MLHRLISLLFGHPQVGPQLIQRLSETWPIRKAAKYTAYLYLRGKYLVEESAKEAAKSNGPINVKRFRDTFSAELRKGLEDAKREARKGRMK